MSEQRFTRSNDYETSESGMDNCMNMNLVKDCMGMTQDVAVTTKVVVIMQVISAMPTTGPAPAVSTGGVSGHANVTVTATLLSTHIAIDPPLFCSYMQRAEKDICLNYFLLTVHL